MVVQRLWQGGGTETHVLALATGLQQRGHSVGIFTAGGAWTRYAKLLGIRVHIPTNGFSSSALLRTIRTHHYKIVHGHDSHSYQLISGLPASHSSSSTATVHGFYINPLSIQQLSPKVRAIFATSPAVNRFLVTQCHIPSRKIHVVPNGVSTHIFDQSSNKSLRVAYHIPKNAFLIGYAARFTFDKLTIGKRIARIVSKYARRKENVYLIIAGRESQTSVSSQPKVIVAGHIPKMQRFYHACDLVIGSGRVAIEAMSCGVPTIAIGPEHYFGRVGPENVRRAIDTNFGDHAPNSISWHSHNLIKDIQYLKHHKRQATDDAHELKKLVHRKLSLKRMVAKTLHVYGTLR